MKKTCLTDIIKLWHSEKQIKHWLSCLILSPPDLMVVEAISQYCPSTSQQSCQGMSPSGTTLVRSVVLTAAAATPETNCTRCHGRCHLMPMIRDKSKCNFYHQSKLVRSQGKVFLSVATQLWCIHSEMT